jgi:DNA-binding MarR family transcriptional regulator
MKTARARRTPDRDEPGATVVPRNGGFVLDTWLPHEFSFIANHFSAVLEGMYSRRYGISVTGWRIIAVLANHAPLSAKELAERTAMNPVAITRSVDDLVRVGMVRRRIDARDRRRVVLRLSDKGVATYREVIPVAIRMEDELLRYLPREEVMRLRQTMSLLAKRAEALFGENGQWQPVAPGMKGQQ